VVQGFKRTRGGVVASLSATEVAVLGDLLRQLIGLLEERVPDNQAERHPLAELVGMDEEASGEAPEDPALARLLPDAYRDNEELAGEFRRFTEADLREGKTSAATLMLTSLPTAGGQVVLGEDGANAWLGGLNDLRLTLGTRLDVTENTYADFEELSRDSPEDPRLAALSVFVWLGYLQETLVDALS
jgi:hypothetical protein